MPRSFLLAGLGFGDESKGSITDWLTRQHKAHTVIRYNSGPQAAHNVVTDDGRHHTFAQFGSGTFAGARTHLSRFMLVNPIALLNEGRHLQSEGVPDAFDRVTIEEDALVINPFQIAANRIREMLRTNRHGSCGMGVGEAVSDSLRDGLNTIRVKDLANPEVLRSKLTLSQTVKGAEFSATVRDVLWDGPSAAFNSMRREAFVLCDPNLVDDLVEVYADFAKLIRIVDASFLDDLLHSEVTTIFEGAQGMLLDKDFGFHPHTTWADLSFRNAHTLLEGHDDIETTRIGIIRAHMSRHGAGPFLTEDKTLRHPTDHNSRNEWQENFRVGYFDAPIVRYALKSINSTAPIDKQVDSLALTHLDLVEQFPKVCNEYRAMEQPDRFTWAAPDSEERLVQQEDHGKRWLAATPVYENVRSSEEMIEFVHNEICETVGVDIVSFGPKPSDKRYE